jgi:hypothetical protein
VWWTKWPWTGSFQDNLVLSRPVFFHAYSIILFILKLLLQEGFESEDSETSNKKNIFHIMESSGQKRV